jgi:DNA-binding GntR family transcriptional regulator
MSSPHKSTPKHSADVRPIDGKQSLADQVFQWICDEITVGVLRPGQLVSENELAARFGVSRSPVREALIRLAWEGLVDVRPQRGTIVSELTAPQIEGLFQAIELVEPEMVRLAIENATDEDVDHIATAVAGLREPGIDLATFWKRISYVDHLLTRICPNRTISDLTEILGRRSSRLTALVLSLPGAMERDAAFYESLVDFVRRRDGEGAKRAFADAVARTRHDLLDQLFISIDGTPVARSIT